MFVAAAEDLTYCSIIDSTPISKKKKYHGVDYCFSKEDSSKDLKMTKIQERYLISEKASHCSSVFTPETQRALMESRKRKLEKLKAKQEAIQKGRKGVDSSVGGVATSQQVAAGVNSQNLSLIPTSSSTAPIPIPSASSVPVLRKSPRKTQRKNVSSLEGEKKELSLKTLLGQAVVDALKKSGMPRSHQHFKACYKRLYNLSKTFMKVRNHSINWDQ